MGQQPSEKSPPAPSPQTKASEKVLGGFFRTVVVPLVPCARTPLINVCLLINTLIRLSQYIKTGTNIEKLSIYIIF